MLQRFLEAAEQSADATLRYAYQKQLFKGQLLSKQDLDYIAREVAKRLSIHLDASEIITEIDEIEKRLNKLGK